VALFDGDPTTGYKLYEWITFHALEQNDPNSWACFNDNMYTKNEGKFTASAGETCWGGAGFIALYDNETNEYCWLLHLNNCNNFKSISIKSGVIFARSDYSYPEGTEFCLPIAHPELMKVSNLY